MDVLLTNPHNREHLYDVMFQANPLQSMDAAFLRFEGIPVEFHDYIPERHLVEVWEPPKGRFIEYGPEDEWWARPLGVGDIRVEDQGPLFFLMKRVGSRYRMCFKCSTPGLLRFVG